MVTTISSLPPEIILLILELASLRNYCYTKSEEEGIGRWHYHKAKKVLSSASLVSPSWTNAAQSLLLQSVVLHVTKEKHLSFFNAPLHRFQVKELIIRVYDKEEYAIEDILSSVEGLEMLQIYTNSRSFSVSVFDIPELSTIRDLQIHDTFITDFDVFSRSTFKLPFNLQRLSVKNAKFSKLAVHTLITSHLISLNIIQSERTDVPFQEGLRIAAPFLKELYIDFALRGHVQIHSPMFSLCTSLVRLTIHVPRSIDIMFPETPQLLTILSAFQPNQLRFLSLKVHTFTSLKDIVPALRLPSVSRLQSLTFISMSFLAIRYSIVEECVRRDIDLSIIRQQV